MHIEANPGRAKKTKPITRRELFWRLLHRAVIKDLAFAALDKAFRLSVKIEDWAGKGLDRAHRADMGAAEGTVNALLEFCASLVIEKRHYYIIVSFADKIELAFKGNPIMLRRQGAVRSVHHTVLDLPVGDELCDGTLPSLGLVVNVPITIPLDSNGTERAGDEESAEVDEIELLARLIR